MRIVINRRRVSRPDERGSSLLMAIVAISTMSLIFATVAGYAAVNQRSVDAYRDVRDARYAGETAINTAINWAKDTYNVGRDPDLSVSDPDCVVHTPTDIGTITSSCEAEAGSGSGQPAQGGLIPEEALVLLGDRTTEPGPYNREQCQGWWDTFTGWFSNGVDPNATGPAEYSAWFRVRKGLGAVQATCNQNRSRTATQFDVTGDIAAAGNIIVEQGSPASVSSVGSLEGTVTARRGCLGPGVSGCGVPGNRSDGTPKDSDPGRPVPPGVTPVGPSGDIKEAWLPVGFKADGSLRSGVSMPVRKDAFIWNPTTGVLNTETTGSCSSVSTTLVFLPGWYTKSHTLNQYTTNPNCNGVTFWFAPDPGPDNKLLTEDDRTGAFYFDFRAGPAIGCNGMPSLQSRWCIGGSAAANIRVVTGIPKDWGPLGSPPLAGMSDPRTRIKVEQNTANTVDSGLSQVWHNGNNAKSINGASAYYSPCTLLFITCPSIDRAIRVRNFTPQVTSPPIDDPGFENGRIYVEIAYGLYNDAELNDPVLEVNAVSNESGSRDCGDYTLPKLTYSGSGPLPATYRFTDAQAKQLADACGSIDLINGFEFTLKVSGDTFNTPWGDPPRIYLDGARLEYDTFQGANFPNPVSTSNVAAQSDCDDTLPGAQLIFAGESHVYVADGSLEVCGGPYPEAPENHQVIGLYGVPAVKSLGAATVSPGGGNGSYQLINGNNAKKIDYSQATIQYGTCHAFCGSTEEGRANLTMESYAAPTGYRVKRVEARVSYNPKNSGCFFLWGCPGAAPQLRTPGGCTIDLPKNPDNGPLQVANLNSLVLYEYGGTSCITTSHLSAGAQLSMAARADCVFTLFLGNVCSPVWQGPWTDTLDGIELDITLEPTDTSKPYLIPQSGCIVAHPNYGGGEGQPDCAMVRADTASFADTYQWFWETKEGEWVGRVSTKGTIYAPSAVMEIDDTDYAYPLGTRGAILRHLRVSGWGERDGYQGAAISNEVDKTPSPRVATFTACTQSAARRAANEPCDAANDTIITRALVRFDTDAGWPDDEKNARVPRIEWWATEL